MLRWRLISAAIILTVLFALLWLDYRCLVFHTPGAWLLPVLVVVSILATEEVLSLLRAKGHRPIAWIIYLGNVLLPLAAGLPIIFQLAALPIPGQAAAGLGNASLLVLALVSALVFGGEMARFQRAGTAIVDAALAIFTLVYIGVCISFWAHLRLLHDNAWGMTALFSLLLIVKMADVGAFAFGKRFGRHKLTPILSPGKTWEGAIGGILTACVTSWAFFQFGAPLLVKTMSASPSPAASLAYGLLLALAGIVGDLAESLLKRDMERKDSSTWLRGLGGVLDIIDAPLVAGPVAWLCWIVGLVGP